MDFKRKISAITAITTALLLSLQASVAINTCPAECNCTQTTLTMAARTVPDITKNIQVQKLKEPLIRSVTCVLQRDTVISEMFRKLPQDTQVLTVIQTDMARSFVLSDKHLRLIQGLIGFEIQAVENPSGKRTSMYADVVKSQRKLQFLRLQNVDATAMDSSTFSKLSGLKVLHLNNAGLQAFPSDLFHSLPSLEEISLQGNALQEIPSDAFKTLFNLKRLNLSDNKLHCHDNCTGNRPLHHLQTLDLANNAIGQVSSLTFLPMPSLTSLRLHGNPIQVVFPYAFQAMSRLEHLTIGHHRQTLHILPFSFLGLTNLAGLELPNIDNNVLEHGMFAGLASVKQLVVQGRVQQITENAFAGVPTLVSISVRNCRLRRLYRDAFNGLRQLQHLDLSHNRMNKVNPSAFVGMKSLRELHLQYNQLQELPRRFFTVLSPTLRSLRLEGNPWNCSTCDPARWKHATIGRVGPKSPTDHKYVRDKRLAPICHFPPQYHGKPVLEVVKKQLKCLKKKPVNQ